MTLETTFIVFILVQLRKTSTTLSIDAESSYNPCYSYSTGPGIYGSKLTRVQGRSLRRRAVYIAINPWQPCYHYIKIIVVRLSIRPSVRLSVCYGRSAEMI